jgi:hypothetical protein
MQFLRPCLSRMRSALRCTGALLATYFVAWTMSYELMFISRGDGLDFGRYFEYLVWAWSFRGGELPTLIWWFSIVAFVPMAVGVVLLMKRSRQN